MSSPVIDPTPNSINRCTRATSRQLKWSVLWCLLMCNALSVLAQVPPATIPVRPVASEAAPNPEKDVLALADIERLVALERERLGPIAQGSMAQTPSSPTFQTESAPDLPPNQMLVSEGITLAIPVGLGHVNRLRAPFEAFRVLHQSTATVKKQGASLYVTPIERHSFAVYLEEKAPPHRSIGLLLQPHPALPPVQVALNWEGTPGLTDAEHNGPVDDHVAQLRHVLRTLALGRTPTGMVMRPVQDWEHAPDCGIPGLQVDPLRVVQGAEFRVVIFRASNLSAAPLEIREEACWIPGVLAVAAFPESILPVGGHSELFLVIRNRPANSSLTDTTLGAL